MKVNYFKARKYLDFSHHRYDVGNPFGSWKNTADSHFLNKIYHLSPEHYHEFYNYHLTHTLTNKVAGEEEFFKKVWELIEDRITYFKQKDPFDRSHAIHLDRIEQLQEFQKMLNSIDKWNARPTHIVLVEKDLMIQQYKDENEKLKQHISDLNQYEVKQKISIEEEHLPTLIDLFQQMRRLTLPSGRPLLRCDHKIPYAKLIAKYFSHGEKDIPVETARNYFVEKPGDIPTKGTTIYPDQQFFKISSKK